MLTFGLLLAQAVPVPSPGQEPWPWVAALAVSALAYVGLRTLNDKDKQIEQLTTALTATTASLTATTETVERQGVSVSQGLRDNTQALATQSQELRRNGDILATIDRRLDNVINDPAFVAPRRRAGS